MRFAFIAGHRHIWPVSWLCEVLEVSRSGFHAWLNRPTSAREIHDAKLVAAIETSFKASDRTYGARRVWRDVLEGGLACGLHRVERLMRNSAMRARPRRRGRECPVFCVWLNRSMLPEWSTDDDIFQRTAGRVAEGLQAA